MSNYKFLSLFPTKKPVLGMIHLKGETDQAVKDRAKKEIDIYVQNGIDGIVLENYYGDFHQLEWVVKYAAGQSLPVPYGVNCLNHDAMGFELAREYSAAFIQLDSVVGHVKPRDEATTEAFLKLERSRCNAAVLGGVRFKYQPVFSENSVEEDLHIAMDRCDAICVTQDATGQATSMEKILRFRNAIGTFPLIVAAGVTGSNIQAQMRVCDAAIVGSYFKDNRRDDGDLSAAHVKEIMDIMTRFREEEKQ